MKLKVWTEAYRPFLMGGDVHAPIATEVEVGEPVELSNGLKVYMVVSPTGNTYVAEESTGAFVGTDMKVVMGDADEADPVVLKKQLEQAAERVKKATMLDPEKFWSMFKD